ncbi:MAG: ABC transporter permease [Acidobacteriota bacterium]
MRRLLSAMVCDVRLQFRNGFYYAVAFVLACWVILLSQLPPLDWAWLLPVVILGNVAMSAFYFIGGLVLLERAEGSIQALVVTPLRRWEYLASKVITLSILGLVENLILVVIARGMRFQAGFLIAGVVFSSLLFALVGFLVVARYESINQYLLPSVLYVTLLSLPYLHYFGIWDHPLMYAHPLLPSLLLMKGAFSPMSRGELAYCLLYSAVWVGVTFVAGRRSFQRFLVVGERGS